jgi:hypothetical protein
MAYCRFSGFRLPIEIVGRACLERPAARHCPDRARPIQTIQQCLSPRARLHFCSVTASTTQSEPLLSVTGTSFAACP